MKPKTIIFFGSSHHSIPVLEALFNHPDYLVLAVVSQPNRPFGRTQRLTPTPPSFFAQKNHLPLFQPGSVPCKGWLYEPKAKEKLRDGIQKLKPDLLVTAYYGQKIPLEILELAKFGGLNLHASLLPQYRGPSPGQWAILAGEKEAGITILTIEEKFDQGQIVAQKKILIKKNDNYETLYTRCFKAGAKLLLKILPEYFQGEIDLKKQPSKSPTPYARKLKKEDGRIDWQKDDKYIERMIRAFYPWPGVFTSLGELVSHLECPEKIKKLSTKLRSKKVKILKAHLNNQGQLIIDKVQVEGKKLMDRKEFLTGYLM